MIDLKALQNLSMELYICILQIYELASTITTQDNNQNEDFPIFI